MSPSVALALLLLAPPPAQDEPKPALYYPTEVGTQMVYQEGDGKESTEEVTAVERKGDKIIVTTTLLRDGRKSTEKTEVSAAGVRHLSHREAGRVEDRYDPPLCALVLPPKAGQTWGSNTDGLTGTSTCRGVERVTVPAGTYDAVRVDAVYFMNDEPDKRTRTSHWYAPGVGEVKLVVDGKTDRVLKSFTPGRGERRP